jgi:hypothetical protein
MATERELLHKLAQRIQAQNPKTLDNAKKLLTENAEIQPAVR